MPVLSGNTADSATSTAYTNTVEIKSFSLVNKTGGAVTVNVSILFGSTNVWITPFEKSLSVNEAYIYSGEPIKLTPGMVIYVLVSGSTDYYFSID